MRWRAADQHQAGDSIGMTTPRLERNLDAHGMSDEDRARGTRIVEDGGEIIREIGDADARQITRRL